MYMYWYILNCAFSNRCLSVDTISTHIHNAYTALTGQVPSSRSAGVGVDRPDNSPGLYHCGGGPGKSNSHPSPQQRKSNECGRGRLTHA